MPIIPASEYRDLFFTRNFGPFDVGDFLSSGAADGPDLSSIATSFSSNLSTSTSASAVTTGGPEGPFSSGSISGAVATWNYTTNLLHDKDLWLDAAWVRCDEVSSDNLRRLRLLYVADRQVPAQAYLNRQFLTKPFNVGDESSSQSSYSFTALVANHGKDLAVYPNHNKIPKFGRLLFVFDAQPAALEGLIIGCRFRERRL